MIRIWRRMQQNRMLARQDADMLIEKYGPAAYEVAWTMSRDVSSGELIDQRPEGHWERVLALIAGRHAAGNNR